MPTPPPSYEPKPIDTSSVQLTHDILELTELLAKNVHDRWASQRFAEGWRYGPQRDDARKESPNLVPYEMLPETEKDLDRNTAMQTLKSIVGLGYCVGRVSASGEGHAVSFPENQRSPTSEPPAGAIPCRAPVNDDMDDSEDIPRAAQPLRGFLEQCRAHVQPAYDAVDGAAMDFQKKYRRRATAAAILGSTAVVLATVQLSGLADHVLASHWSWLVPVLEFAAALATLLIVLLGMGTFLKEQWLLERYKAESLRLLKFRWLLETGAGAASSAEAEKRKARLCDKVEEIATTTFSALQGWIARGTVPTVQTSPTATLTRDDLDNLVRYYSKKRLHNQMAYLSQAVQRDQRRDRHTRLAGPSLFFGSVAFVLAHLAVEIGGDAVNWSKLLILIAAALPVMGAGFRIYRAANEFARNASRCEAVHHALSELSARLREASDAPAVFRELGFCEQVLESDLREWMRLMVEAEWFG